MIVLLLIILSCVFGTAVQAQGFFSGSFQSNTNFFIRDSAIGAANLPHYDNFKVGTDAWLNLSYNNEKYGLEVGARLDFLYNTILWVPTNPQTNGGLGIVYIKKKVKDVTITGGYFYDQIASGIIYRSWEERPLGIDNALLGARVQYDFKDYLKVKAFTGVQKNRFTIYKQLLTGFNAEGNVSIKDKVRLQPGVGFLNRSMDRESMDLLVSRIETLDSAQRFVPKFNVYALTFYNTLTAGNFSWYIEGAFKTREAVRGYNDILYNKPGNIIYTTLNYSQKGLGITFAFKRTEYFSMRISPNDYNAQGIFQGLMNFLPPVSKQHSMRLPARYFAPSQDQQELAFGADITYSPNKKMSFNFNGSYIRDFIKGTPVVEAKLKDTDTMLTPVRNYFAEGFVSGIFKPMRTLEVEVGFQYVRYNRLLYLNEGNVTVDAYSPFAEVSYRFNKKMSVRMEVQYQHVAKDFGQWIYGLLEFNVAPRWSVAVSDMWNFKPNPENPVPSARKGNHYYSAFLAFTHHAHRFSINYVKQVEGIVCTGGVCRFEPAFSGVKVAITSTF
ncbi:MAG: hypothetical protein KF872_02880 [Chitinophagales bacterium]|nr:hypothetical protein [Chitinophagales bacterium]